MEEMITKSEDIDIVFRAALAKIISDKGRRAKSHTAK